MGNFFASLFSNTLWIITSITYYNVHQSQVRWIFGLDSLIHHLKSHLNVCWWTQITCLCIPHVQCCTSTPLSQPMFTLFYTNWQCFTMKSAQPKDGALSSHQELGFCHFIISPLLSNQPLFSLWHTSCCEIFGVGLVKKILGLIRYCHKFHKKMCGYLGKTTHLTCNILQICILNSIQINMLLRTWIILLIKLLCWFWLATHSTNTPLLFLHMAINPGSNYPTP